MIPWLYVVVNLEEPFTLRGNLPKIIMAGTIMVDALRLGWPELGLREVTTMVKLTIILIT